MKLRYTLPALADLEDILDYIEEKSPQGAARVKSRIQTTISLLLRHPLIGARTDDPAIRRMIVLRHPYVVLYEATDDELITHAVRHTSRKPV
ncbi:MAG: type II toxin-antitoxin system RelE/ParE family toxin [Methylocystis sp.]